MTVTQQAGHRLEDQNAIQNVLHRYCNAIDRMQFIELEQVFYEDAVIKNGESELTRAQFIKNVTQRHPTVAVAFHMLGNISIELFAQHRAFTQSYCMAFESHTSAKQGVIERTFRVRYGDLFERREGLWKISQRRTVIDHEQAIPANLTELPIFHNEHNAGVRSEQDAILQMRTTYITST